MGSPGLSFGTFLMLLKRFEKLILEAQESNTLNSIRVLLLVKRLGRARGVEVYKTVENSSSIAEGAAA